jgi:hypothetical protein
VKPSHAPAARSRHDGYRLGDWRLASLCLRHQRLRFRRTCEQALARRLFGRLEEGWLQIADRGFYDWPGWQAAAGTPRCCGG